MFYESTVHMLYVQYVYTVNIYVYIYVSLCHYIIYAFVPGGCHPMVTMTHWMLRPLFVKPSSFPFHSCQSHCCWSQPSDRLRFEASASKLQPTSGIVGLSTQHSTQVSLVFGRSIFFQLHHFLLVPLFCLDYGIYLS